MTTSLQRLIRIVLWTLVFASGAAAAQQVTISKSSTLYAEPAPNARSVGQLKEGTSAEVIGRQGAFVNVKSASGTGWIFAFNVNFGSTGSAAAATSAQRRPSANPTMGIRGLDKEEMKNATFDGKQLDALDAFAGADKGGSDKK